MIGFRPWFSDEIIPLPKDKRVRESAHNKCPKGFNRHILIDPLTLPFPFAMCNEHHLALCQHLQFEVSEIDVRSSSSSGVIGLSTNAEQQIEIS